MRKGRYIGGIFVAAIGLLRADAPLAEPAHTVLLSHSVYAGDQGRLLRTFRPPKDDWTRPEFDDAQWSKLSSHPPEPGPREPGAVLVPSLWSQDAVQVPSPKTDGSERPPEPQPSGPGLPIYEEAPPAGSEPETAAREIVTDSGSTSSPPVAVVDVVGAAVRAGLASGLPAALLVASPVLGKHSGRSARPSHEPLLPACGGSLYLRRKFDFWGAPGMGGSAGTLLLRIRYSDGFVAHINGSEVVRSRLPEPPPGTEQLLASDRGPSDPERYYVPVSLVGLRGRGNVLAIEAHPKSPLRCPQVEAELVALSGPRLLRGPYIERMSDNSLDVTVETELPSRIVLRYGRGEKLQHRDREVESPGPAQTVHRLHLSGLKAGTLYHYQVALLGEGARRSDLALQTFHTPPVAGMPIKVVVYGDSRSGHPVHAQVLQAILAEDPDLVLHTGDLVERGTEEGDWDRFFAVTAPLLSRTPVYISPGNHDYAVRKQGAARLFALFQTMFAPQVAVPPGESLPPSRVLAQTVQSPQRLANFSEAARGYYSFDVAGVHFVSIDSNQAGKVEQHRWLDADLTRATAQQPRPRAIIAWMHEGPFSVGWHGDYPTAIRHLVPILTKHQTTLLVSGHDHDYERGQRQGLDYVVTGGGGAELRPLRCDPRRRKCKNQPQFFANEHHYLRLEILPQQLRICPRRPDGTPLEECQAVKLRKL